LRYVGANISFQLCAAKPQRAGWQVEYHWVPGHADVEGNEQSDKTAKKAAAFPVPRGVGRMTRNEQFTAPSYLHRRTKELKSKETKNGLMPPLEIGPAISVEGFVEAGDTLRRHEGGRSKGGRDGDSID
jgi:hypothetical protein